jgi:hypothetical protein
MNIFLDEPARLAHVSEFNERGYTALRQVFDRHDCTIYATYALMQRFNGYYREVNHQFFRGRYNRYADVLGESLLVNLKPMMEAATGRTLLPTYSFLRIYERGNRSLKHTDRLACEISATICLGGKGQEDWPLWIESQNEPHPVSLAPGDLLIFCGGRLPHWREQFNGQHCVQLFLHYVDAHGPLAEHKFDRRLMPGVSIRHNRVGQLVRSDGNE